MMRHLAVAVALAVPGALAAQDDSGFVAWGRPRVAALDSTAAIAALAPGLGPVRLIGVGESVHDVRQFFEFRLALLQSLVRHHRVRAVVLESGLPEGMAADDYVSGRTDTIDFDAALKYGFGSYEEVRRSVRWLREWNAGPGRAAPVRLLGIDLPASAGSMVPALDRLTGLVPDPTVRATVALIRPIAERATGPFFRPAIARYDSLGPATRDSLQRLTARLVQEVERIRLPDAERTRWARRLARVAQQTETMFRLGAYHPDNPRDRAMAENTRWVLDQVGPGDRVVLWAHNAHVQRYPIEGPPVPTGTTPSMGTLLGRELGAGYLAVGTAYGGASLDSAAAPVAGGVDRALGALGPGPYLLPLRGRPSDGPLAAWLDARRPMRFQLGHLLVPLGRAFDAVAYFDRVDRAVRVR